MFRNYFKIAIRNLWKNKLFSMINVAGLAIGLSASFVIGVMIYYDLTFDKFHTDSELIYRVTSNFTSPDGPGYSRGVAIPLADALKTDVPGIEKVTTFFNTYVQKVEIKNEERVFKNIDDIVYADKNYFSLFQYKWLAGSPKGLNDEPNIVVITKSRAEKYFPGMAAENVLGKVLTYNDSIPVKISGIVADFEERSDFNFKEFLSLHTAISLGRKNRVFGTAWNSTNSATQVFIKIPDVAVLDDIQLNLDLLAKEQASEELLSYGMSRGFGLQPLNDIHFNADYGIFNNSRSQPSKSVLLSLALIALFLLILGGINFINLNTALATKRAKEIGIRKTLGSSRKQLVSQFLGETFILTLCAAAVSIVLSYYLLMIFADFIPQGVTFDLFSNPFIVTSIAVLLLGVAFLSGFYPALVLSNFKPILVLKGDVVTSDNKQALRKYLTVFQFVIAQIFIIATLLVGKQMNFLMSKDMGFKTKANAYVRAWHDDDLPRRYMFMERVKLLPGVSNVSLGGDAPASSNKNSSITTFLNEGEEIHTDVDLLFGDLEYLQLYDIQLLAGRDRLNDTIKEFVINETYQKILGFKNPLDAIDQTVKMNGEMHQIVGVMKDFNQRSLRSKIEPMVLSGDRNRTEYAQFNTIHIALEEHKSMEWTKTLGTIEKEWSSLYPEIDFEVSFMDDDVKQFYEQERRSSVLLKWAMTLAILISCLGLLGLVIYTTERRTKEIGIRKVLGASIAQLNFMLCKEFVILVGIAFLIAAPIAWWGLHNWFANFAYKTSLSWWLFLLSGIAMICIALFMMSIKTIAAAKENPVDSLRME